MKAKDMIKDIFIWKAQKYNHYQEGLIVESQSCAACIRKHFSYPYTCNDGWAMGNSEWQDRGKSCSNWTDKKDAPVD